MKWDMDMPCHTVTIKTTWQRISTPKGHPTETPKHMIYVVCFCFQYLNQFQYCAGTILHKTILLYLGAIAWKLLFSFAGIPNQMRGSQEEIRANGCEALEMAEKQCDWWHAINETEISKSNHRQWEVKWNEGKMQEFLEVVELESWKKDDPKCGRARELRQGCEVDPRQLQKRLTCDNCITTVLSLLRFVQHTIS